MPADVVRVQLERRGAVLERVARGSASRRAACPPCGSAPPRTRGTGRAAASTNPRASTPAIDVEVARERLDQRVARPRGRRRRRRTRASDRGTGCRAAGNRDRCAVSRWSGRRLAELTPRSWQVAAYDERMEFLIVIVVIVAARRHHRHLPVVDVQRPRAPERARRRGVERHHRSDEASCRPHPEPHRGRQGLRRPREAGVRERHRRARRDRQRARPRPRQARPRT